METLAYDFKEEKNFNYKGLTKQEQALHISKFVSGLWQIHAFGEGNTRTTAVFIIKYLRSLGFKVETDMFASNSWFFRNALARANYNDYQNNIYATEEYLMKFFGNLLFDENNELKNRYLHIRYIAPDTEKPDVAIIKTQNDTLRDTLDKNDTLNDTLKAVLLSVKQNPKATQAEIAAEIGKGIVTVKRATEKLVSLGIIKRKNGKKNDYWDI
jgi:hypothetical protein